MIHIILAILKIVGILLAVLLGLVAADPSDRFIFASAVSHMCRKTRGTEKKYCKRQCELAVWHPEGKSRLPEWADILCTADFRKKDRFRQKKYRADGGFFGRGRKQ